RIGSPSSSLPILGSQQNPRARLFGDQRGMRDGFRPSRDRSDSTCWVCWLPEGKAPLVREERGIVASSLPVVRQGTVGPHRSRGRGLKASKPDTSPEHRTTSRLTWHAT